MENQLEKLNREARERLKAQEAKRPSSQLVHPLPKGRPKFTGEQKLKHAVEKKGALLFPDYPGVCEWKRAHGDAELLSGRYNKNFWIIFLTAVSKIFEQKGPVLEKPDDLIDASMAIKALSEEVRKRILPVIEFDEDDVRRATGNYELTSSQIAKAVDDASRVVIKTPEFEKVVRFPDDTEVWYYHRWRFQPCPIEDNGKRVRVKGRWKGRMIKKYRLHFISEPQLLMFQNIIDKEFTLIENKKKFFKLPSEPMTLFLAICWVPGKPAILKFDEILTLVGWERWDEDNHSKQVKKVESVLERLKKDGWIGDWQRLRGEVYKIFKADFNKNIDLDKAVEKLTK